ncbi:MAG: penicillin-binding transpeptidase domain-containing protein, partial [Chitinophagaceae bacterium]
TDYRFGPRIMHDAEQHPTEVVSVKEALEMSSNVGFSKLVYFHYNNDPQKFVNDLKKLGMDQKTGIDIAGEVKPIIVSPKSKTWSSTTLPWMGIGYEVLQTPIRLLTLYNAVANNGVMMKPYLVNSIEQYGKVIKQFEPTVLNPKICSDTVLRQVQACLEGVVESDEGTAHKVLDNPYYKIAGKTGTAQVANGIHGYADHIYQATFAGYFPADHPMYSIIVTILNKPHAKHIYGASVAAPVFKVIANKLYALNFEKQVPRRSHPLFDTTLQIKVGSTDELRTIITKLDLPVTVSNSQQSYSNATINNQHIYLQPINVSKGSVPDVRGMGLKDALFLLESAGLKVT